MSRGLSKDEIKTLLEVTEGIMDWGVNGYFGITLFGFASVGFAKILMKTLTKESTPKYSGILTFLSLGTLTSIFLKILNFDIFYKLQGFVLALVINIILFLIVRHIKKHKKTGYENL